MPFRRNAIGDLETAGMGPAAHDAEQTQDTVRPAPLDSVAEEDRVDDTVRPAPLDSAADEERSDDTAPPAAPESAAHEGRTDDTAPPAAPESAADDEAVAEVLEEVAFYESQKLLDDALALVEEQLPSFPDNQRLLASRKRLRDALGLTKG